MKKSKKILALFLCLAVLSFSSCREKGNSNKTPYYEDTIVIYNMYDGTDVFSPVIQEFRQKYKVNIEYKKFSDLRSYENQLISEIAEGVGPDIFVVHNSWVNKHKGKISPAPEDIISPSEYEEEFAKVAVKDFLINTEVKEENEDGKEEVTNKKLVYGVPIGISTLGLYFNEKYFVNNIVSRKKPAETWTEFKEDVYKITRLDKLSDSGFKVSGFAGGRGKNIRRGAEIFFTAFLQHGGRFNNDNNLPVFAETQKGGLLGASSVELLEDFATPSSKYYSWNKNSADPNSDMKEIEGFLKEDVGIIAGYPYLYKKLYEETKRLQGRASSLNYIDQGDIKTALMPQIDDSFKSGEKKAFASYFGFTVSKNSKYKKLSWEFIKTLSSKKFLEDYFESTKIPSAKIELLKDQIKDPIYGPFAEQVSFADSIQMQDIDFTKSVISEALDKVADGVMLPKDAMQQAQSQIQDLNRSEVDEWNEY